MKRLSLTLASVLAGGVLLTSAQSVQAVETDLAGSYTIITSEDGGPYAPNFDDYSSLTLTDDARSRSLNVSLVRTARGLTVEDTNAGVAKIQDGGILGEMDDFSFTFYGEEYTDVYVHANGPIGFEPAASSPDLPSSVFTDDAVNAFIAGVWADMNVGIDGFILAKYDETDGKLYVHYDDVATRTGDGASLLYVIDPSLNTVTVYIEDLPGSSPGGIGIENQDATDGIQLFHDRATGAGLQDFEGTAFTVIPDVDGDGEHALMDPDDRNAEVTTESERRATPVAQAIDKGDIVDVVPAAIGKGYVTVTYANGDKEDIDVFKKFDGEKPVNVRFLKKRATPTWIVMHPKKKGMAAMTGAGIVDRVKLAKKAFKKSRIHHVKFKHKGKTKRAFAVLLKSKKKSRFVLIQKKKAADNPFGKKAGKTLKGKKQRLKIKKKPTVKKIDGKRFLKLSTKSGKKLQRFKVKKWKLKKN